MKIYLWECRNCGNIYNHFVREGYVMERVCPECQSMYQRLVELVDAPE